jgi:hypothetical protein
MALAAETTARGAVTLDEADARRVAASVGARLREAGQIGRLPEPASVLAVLTAHDVLERVEYPPALRFDHQQFQEFFAATRGEPC